MSSVVSKQIIDEINNSITEDVRKYCMSLFIDSRLKLDIDFQIFIEPAGYEKAVYLFRQYGNMLVTALKTYRPDLNNLATKLSETPDYRERLAIWASEYSDQ